MPKTDDSDLHEIPLFADVPSRQLQDLRGMLTLVRTNRTAEVVKAGSVGREFLVLRRGSAKVMKGDQVVATLGAGDAFGEIALLTGSPRNATVVVDEGSELYAANPGEFAAIVSEFPQVAEKLEALAAARS